MTYLYAGRFYVKCWSNVASVPGRLRLWNPLFKLSLRTSVTPKGSTDIEDRGYEVKLIFSPLLRLVALLARSYVVRQFVRIFPEFM